MDRGDNDFDCGRSMSIERSKVAGIEMEAYSDVTREDEPTALPDLEVFYVGYAFRGADNDFSR